MSGKWNRKSAVISLSPEIQFLNSQLQELGGGLNTRAGQLACYCRIAPSRRRSASDYVSAVTIDQSSHEIIVKHQLLTSGESKSQRFAVETVFDVTCENGLVRNCLLNGEDKNSAVSWTWSGFNTAVLTYGEVDSGKSFSLFSQVKGVKSVYEHAASEFFRLIEDAGKIESEDLSVNSAYSLGVSIWELVHSQTDRCEVVSDLLRTSEAKPLPGGQDLTTVLVASLEEAVTLFQAAKELSENWRTNSEGGFDSIHNRGHFFIRFLLYEGKEQRVSSLHLIDLAGALPSNLSPDLRTKLGSDEQLTVIRMGLNQFRSIIWELGKSEKSVDLSAVISTRKSKLAQFLGPVLAGNCRTYLLGCVREDSNFAEACKTMELLVQAQRICTPCMRTTGVDKQDLKFVHFSIIQA